MSHNDRIYAVRQTGWAGDTDPFDCSDWTGAWRPEGWLDDPDVRAEWIERHGDDRFFWPSTDKVYRSRSAATRLVRLIESYGGTAVLMESELVWQPVAEANARRKMVRRRKKIERLRAELASLEAVSA